MTLRSSARPSVRLSACAVALCTPFAVATSAAAQGFNWTYGVDMTSDYISSGESQSDGFAIQPWAEVENNGFYLGVWGSNVDFGDDDKWEYDLLAGYRADVTNNFSYDVGLARYAYDSSNYSNSEATLGLTYTFDNAAYVTGFVGYDWENENVNRSVEAGYAFNSRISSSATYGVDDGAGTDYYWDVGGTYAFNDTIALDARYHGRDGDDEGLVATLKFAF